MAKFYHGWPGWARWGGLFVLIAAAVWCSCSLAAMAGYLAVGPLVGRADWAGLAVDGWRAGGAYGRVWALGTAFVFTLYHATKPKPAAPGDETAPAGPAADRLPPRVAPPLS